MTSVSDKINLPVEENKANGWAGIKVSDDLTEYIDSLIRKNNRPDRKSETRGDDQSNTGKVNLIDYCVENIREEHDVIEKFVYGGCYWLVATVFGENTRVAFKSTEFCPNRDKRAKRKPVVQVHIVGPPSVSRKSTLIRILLDIYKDMVGREEYIARIYQGGSLEGNLDVMTKYYKEKDYTYFSFVNPEFGRIAKKLKKQDYENGLLYVWNKGYSTEDIILRYSKRGSRGDSERTLFDTAISALVGYQQCEYLPEDIIDSGLFRRTTFLLWHPDEWDPSNYKPLVESMADYDKGDDLITRIAEKFKQRREELKKFKKGIIVGITSKDVKDLINEYDRRELLEIREKKERGMDVDPAEVGSGERLLMYSAIEALADMSNEAKSHPFDSEGNYGLIEIKKEHVERAIKFLKTDMRDRLECAERIRNAGRVLAEPENYGPLMERILTVHEKMLNAEFYVTLGGLVNNLGNKKYRISKSDPKFVTALVELVGKGDLIVLAVVGGKGRGGVSYRIYRGADKNIVDVDRKTLVETHGRSACVFDKENAEDLKGLLLSKDTKQVKEYITQCSASQYSTGQ